MISYRNLYRHPIFLFTFFSISLDLTIKDYYIRRSNFLEVMQYAIPDVNNSFGTILELYHTH